MVTTEIGKMKIDSRIYGGIKQFSVFLGNRQEALENLLQSMRANQITAIAFSSVETSDYLVLRIVSNYSENFRNILISSNIPFVEHSVLGVEFFHADDMYKTVGVILAYEIKIHYMYPILVKHGHRIGMVLRVEDVGLAAKAVRSAGISTISQKEIDR
jgi:hypothetical protein